MIKLQLLCNSIAEMVGFECSINRSKNGPSARKYMQISAIFSYLFKLYSIYAKKFIAWNMFIEKLFISKRCRWSNNHFTSHFAVESNRQMCAPFISAFIQIASIIYFLKIRSNYDWGKKKINSNKRICYVCWTSVTPLYVFVMTMNMKTVNITNTVSNNRRKRPLFIIECEWLCWASFQWISFYFPVKYLIYWWYCCWFEHQMFCYFFFGELLFVAYKTDAAVVFLPLISWEWAPSVSKKKRFQCIAQPQMSFKPK